VPKLFARENCKSHEHWIFLVQSLLELVIVRFRAKMKQLKKIKTFT